MTPAPRYSLRLFLESDLQAELHPRILEALEPLLVCLDKGSYELFPEGELTASTMQNILALVVPVENVIFVPFGDLSRGKAIDRMNVRREVGDVRKCRLGVSFNEMLSKRFSTWARNGVPIDTWTRLTQMLNAMGFTTRFARSLANSYGNNLARQIGCVFRTCTLCYLAFAITSQSKKMDEIEMVIDSLFLTFPLGVCSTTALLLTA